MSSSDDDGEFSCLEDLLEEPVVQWEKATLTYVPDK